MRNIHNTYWQYHTTLFAEKRLCALSPVPHAESFPAADSPLYRYAVSIFNKDGTPERVQKRTEQVMAEFSEGMPPSILSTLDKGLRFGESLSLEEVQNLTSFEQWINAFKDPNLFDPAVTKMTLKNGPLGLLKSLEVDERKNLYHDFVYKTIRPELRGDVHDGAEDAQDIYIELFGPDDLAERERINTLLNPADVASTGMNRRELAMQAIEGIYGMKDPSSMNDEARSLALASLNHRYWVNGTRFLGGKKLDVSRGPHTKVVTNKTTKKTKTKYWGSKSSLYHDISRAMRLHPGDTGSITDLMGSLPPSSQLRGAIRMGVIEDKDIPEINDLLDDRKAERSNTTNKATKKLSDLSQVATAERERDAETISDRLAEFTPAHWLAAGVGLYFLLNSKGADGKSLSKMARASRFGVMGLTGLYFVQKLFLKIDHPVDETWSPIINDTTKFFVNKAEQISGYKLPGDKLTDEQQRLRMQAAERYLSQNLGNYVEEHLTGLVLIQDLSLTELARYMSFDSEVQPIFDGKNEEFIDSISMAHEKLGFGNIYAAEDFFKASGNDKVVGQALGSVFYRIAARDPANKMYVEMIEEVRREWTTADGNYDNLPEAWKASNGRKYNLREKYADLVRQGMNDASNEKLAAHMGHAIGIDQIGDREAVADRERILNNRKDQIVNYEVDGEKVGMAVLEDGEMVDIVLSTKSWWNLWKSLMLGTSMAVAPIAGVGAAMPRWPVSFSSGDHFHPLKISKTEFINRSADEIMHMWMENAVNERKARMEFASGPTARPATAPPSITSFAMRIEGNNIIYSKAFGVAKEAQTPVFEFMKKDDATIFQKFAAWEADTSKPDGSDPLK